MITWQWSVYLMAFKQGWLRSLSHINRLRHKTMGGCTYVWYRVFSNRGTALYTRGISEGNAVPACTHACLAEFRCPGVFPTVSVAQLRVRCQWPLTQCAGTCTTRTPFVICHCLQQHHRAAPVSGNLIGKATEVNWKTPKRGTTKKPLYICTVATIKTCAKAVKTTWLFKQWQGSPVLHTTP